MSNPITLIDDQFIKLSFDFFLCLKQILICIALYFLVLNIHYFFFKTDEDESDTSSNIPQAPMNETQIHYMNTMEERRRKREADRLRELGIAEEKEKLRAAERKYKIDSALASRGSQTKSKTCSQCGGAFGNGSACQWCGQES